MSRCALYLRSSKDRADVSIDAQRRELSALAAGKSLAIAAEFADPVERADDWQRPGFSSLLRALAKLQAERSNAQAARRVSPTHALAPALARFCPLLLGAVVGAE